MVEITAQIFGIFGLIFSVISYQKKNNRQFFIMQGLAGLMFFINYALIGAVSAASFNMVNLIRGALFSKKEPKMWKLVIITAAYLVCYIVGLWLIIGNPFQIFLSTLVFVPIELMTVLMWKGNGRHIRYAQFFVSSPSWLIHNIFNFTLGGILCEVFMMTSVVISFIRFGKDGFEK